MTSVVMTRMLLSIAATAAGSLLHLAVTHATTASVRKPTSPLHGVADELVTDDAGPFYTDEANADKISQLPGLDGDPGFNQFAGYLTVSEQHQRNIFYWYVESQSNPATDPVVLWTNGGPGCSGLLGFGTEHGPFYVGKDGKLSPNPYSWNKVANMIYIEQPAGVGFSYSETESDYVTGDKQAAVDNFVLIQKFFEKFPERKGNPFYISSESYGGHYVPQLTKEILDRNTDGAINLSGFLVGNPYVDPFSNMLTQYDAYYEHGLIAFPLYSLWKKSCYNRDTYDNENCPIYQEAMFREMGKGVNPYALDYPVCTEDGWTGWDNTLSQQAADISLPSRRAQSVSSQGLRLLHTTKDTNDPPFLPNEDDYKPCGEKHLMEYLNTAEVRSALHVKGEPEWAFCSDKVKYSRKDVNVPQIDLYKFLVKMAVDKEIKLNMMIFSGDDDSICSTAGTQYWIYDLGVKPKEDQLWRAWKVEEQTAGFVTHFDLGDGAESTLTFATVHGAGHEVPAYRPMEALQLLKSYFSGNW